MTIEELYLSARSFNVCNYNNLKDLSAILKHYRNYGTFLNIRNCGRKTNEELTALCLKHIEYNNNGISLNSKPEYSLASVISNFSRTQRELINEFIEISLKYLSNRSKNAITYFLKGNLKINNISDKILSNSNFDFLEIENVGKKTAFELKEFIDSIERFIKKVAELESENDLISLRNKIYIDNAFSFSIYPDEIVNSQSVFALVEFLLSKNAVFEKSQNIVFKKAFRIYYNQPCLSLEEIACEMNVSRERVRQIRKEVLDSLANKFQFVQNIKDDFYQKYNIDLSQSLISINDDLNILINQTCNTNFTKEFNTFIVYSCISNHYDLIGPIEDVLQDKKFNSRGRHNWNKFYIVSQDISNLFDFNKLADDLDKRLNDRIEETYSFNFKGYLSNFLKLEDGSITVLVLHVVERIINIEFELLIDLNDNIVFKRNTVKQVPEFAIEALEKLGVPSNIDEIYKLIEKDFPEATKSKEGLRGSLQRTPEIIYFGRSGTYGLKKWETEKEGIKGGTIKDIIIEYLEDKTCPVHIMELLNIVHRYREETSAKNIITNLKLDPLNQFIIFNQSFIGLTSKTYNSKLCNLPKFLGKTITNFVRLNGKINRLSTEEYFSGQLEISVENMNNIVEYLIENKFIKIDNNNNLTI